MKSLIALSLVVVSSSAFAACPSIDKSLKALQAGAADQLVVARATICQIEENYATQPNLLCHTRAGAYADVAATLQDLFNVGAVAKADVDKAVSQAQAAANDCK